MGFNLHSFDIAALIEQREAIIQGILTTLMISASSSVIALVAGLLVAIGRQNAKGLFSVALSSVLSAYVQFFRNTPLLIQIYFFYKALPYAGITLDPVLCGILALSLQTTAYMAEIYRTGLEAVPKEQYESGLSLGMSKFETTITVVIPQAIGVIMPPLGNQVIGVIKNSSLVAFITVSDLFFVVYEQSVTHFRYLEFFTLGVLAYMVMTISASWLLLQCEQWLMKKLKGPSADNVPRTMLPATLFQPIPSKPLAASARGSSNPSKNGGRHP